MTTQPALFVSCALLFCALAVAAPAKPAPQTNVLKRLRKGHPRLLALEADIARVREMIAKDALAKDYHAKLRVRATQILKEPLLKYHVIGPRLLHISRRAVERIGTLALIHRLDGDAVFADRAIKEMLNACAFKDWHPSHFLDTAEMTCAVAIGYDWLYGRLTPEQRKTVADAIVRHGLLAAKPFYDKQRWWVASRHNWNQVCNGGIAVGALAVADEKPDLAAYIIEQSRKSITRAMRSYEPDGGWAEGPGYWHYATRYNVTYLAALHTALGTDLGLLKELPGFAKAGDFRVYFAGPMGQTFNYADAGSRTGRAHEMFWLARTFGRPLYAWHERTRPGRADALDLLWFDPRGQGPKVDKTPLDRVFKGVDVAFLRSAWEDRDAVFVGFKGGDNRANHSHLDLGTFVLDALGRRWALDLGGDHYNLPAYFGSKRWTYYRLRTEGHNTLTIAGKNQDTRAKAPIVAFASTQARAFAVADLSKAYAEAKSWRRGMALLDRREVLVQDEIELKAKADIVWTLHTAATIELDGATATLRQGNDRLRATLLEPKGAVFETASATPPKPQAQNEGVTRLLVRLPGVSRTRIAILLTPYRSDTPPVALRAIAPLEEWAEP